MFENTEVITIRSLNSSELRLLLELYDYNDVNEMMNENTHLIENNIIEILGLFQADRIIGELRIKYESDDALEAVRNIRAYLFAFRIHKDFQKHGLGRKLLEYAIQYLNEKGYREITVGVEDDNNRAKHIYNNAGFIQTIARKTECYQGNSYEYNLLIRKL